MIREISIINKSLVNNNKGGILSHVSKTISFEDEKTFALFPELLTNFHVSFSTFSDNKRNKESFLQTSFLVYDFDDGTPSALIHENLLDISHFIFGSKNHFKDKGDGKGVLERFHAIIPINDCISSVGFFKYIWRDIEKIKIKKKTDKSCCDVTKYYFKHSKMIFENKATMLDISHYYDAYDTAKKLEVAEIKQWGSIRTFDRRNKHYNLLSDLKSGNRNNNCCILVGSMLRCGMDKMQIKSTIIPHIFFDHSFSEEKLDRIINDFSKKPR